MKVFIQEFATGGGLVGQSLSPELLLEGFAMLRKLITNFRKMNFDIITTLDGRLEYLQEYFEANTIILIHKQSDFLKLAKNEIKNCDYFLVIAPSTNKILSDIVKNYSKNKVQSLNCSQTVIDFISSKKNIYEICEKQRINYPSTIVFSAEKKYHSISSTKKTKYKNIQTFLLENELSFPLIIKPNIGDACEGLHLIKDNEELMQHLERKRCGPILIQEFIKGEHLSVTVIAVNGSYSILSVNKQILHFNFNESKYLGGISNIKHPLENEISNFIEQLFSNIKGLKGFLGIDLVIKDENGKSEIFFIEINPRATTPICGLIGQKGKPIEMIKKEDDLQNKIPAVTTYFSKYTFSLERDLTKKEYKTIKEYEAILTPPIRFRNENYSMFVEGKGKNIVDAEQKYQDNIKRLLKKLK